MSDAWFDFFRLHMQHIPLYMPDLVSIEVVGKVQAGSRMKKYHILENSSSKYSFQKQVGDARAWDTGGCRLTAR